jgi:hypothetical protein
MSEQLLRAFFEDLAKSEERAADGAREVLSSANIPAWVDSEAAVRVLREALSTPDQIQALATFVQEMVHVSLHSALVSIDSGSASAAVGQLDLVDAQGTSLGDALHERYVDFLLDTGRMT